MSMFTLEEVNQAINMAVDETSRKAVEVLSSVLDNWVHGGDADCIIAEFKVYCKADSVKCIHLFLCVLGFLFLFLRFAICFLTHLSSLIRHFVLGESNEIISKPSTTGSL